VGNLLKIKQPIDVQYDGRIFKVISTGFGKEILEKVNDT